MLTLIISLPRGSSNELQTSLTELAQRATGELTGPTQIVVLPHLYDLQPDDPATLLLKEIRGDSPCLILSAMYARAAYWTVRSLGVDMPQEQATMLDIREYATDEGYDLPTISDALLTAARAVSNTQPESLSDTEIPQANGSPDSLATGTIRAEGPVDPDRKRWYPVIDADRCIRCYECLNFCLFGVYAIDSDELALVEQPDACRNGCPACSRICPAQAIMFPEYTESHIAGAEADDESTDKTPANTPSEPEMTSTDQPPTAGHDQLIDDIEDMDL